MFVVVCVSWLFLVGGVFLRWYFFVFFWFFVWNCVKVSFFWLLRGCKGSENSVVFLFLLIGFWDCIDWRDLI